MKKTKIISLIILLFIIIQHTTAQSKKAIRLTADYVNVALWEVNNTKQTLKKWEGVDTIAYAFTGKRQYLSKKNWSNFISELEELTGLTFIETSNKESGHINLFFGDINDYFKIIKTELPRNLTMKSNNWSNRRYTKEGKLLSASFCIMPSRIKNSNHGSHLVKKLFLKSLGLLGKSKNEYSLFYKYPTKNNTLFKRYDKRIVKIHYNRHIKAGMDLYQIKKVLNNSVDLDSLLKEKL